MEQTITRVRELNKQDAQLITKIFEMVKGKYADGNTYHFDSNVKVGKFIYRVECDFTLTGTMLSIENRKVQLLEQGGTVQ